MELSVELQNLAELLEKRLEIIGDDGLREGDPDEHLRQLRAISESIMDSQRKLSPYLKPRLAHFLENCSYDKALLWLKENPAG